MHRFLFALVPLAWLAALPCGCRPGGGADGGGGDTGGEASGEAGPDGGAGTSAEAPDGSEALGTITLRAVYTEEPPAPQPIQVDTDPEYCGDKPVDEKFIVDPESNGLKNVVLRLEDVRGPRELPETVTITNRDCMFDGHVGVAMRGTKLKVENDDPILHTTHPYIDGQNFFNAPLANKGDTYGPRPIPKSGLMRIKCDVHSWMEGWIVVHDNPYVAVTDAQGRLEIDQVPAGEHDWVAWHEELGERTGTVRVEPGEAAEISLEYPE